MFKVVPVDIYNTDVLVSIAQTDEELYNSIGSEHSTKEDFEECYNDWTMDARVVYHPTKGFIIMRFRNIIEEHGIIAHEAFHAANIVEPLLNTLKSISCDKNKSRFLNIKSVIVWGHREKGSFPLLYIKKPKHVSQEDFDEIIDHLEIMLYTNKKGSFN